MLLDVRDPADFAGAHLAGSVNIGLGGSYATWAGTVLDRERPLVIVADPGREQEAALRLGRIGFDNVAGFLDGGMQAVDARPDLLTGSSGSPPWRSPSSSRRPTRRWFSTCAPSRERRQARISGSLEHPARPAPGATRRAPGRAPTRRPLPDRLSLLDRRQPAATRGPRADRRPCGRDQAWQASGPNGDGAAGRWCAAAPAAARRRSPRARRDRRRSEEPLNAETPVELLCESQLTPNELFFVRNHGPIPEVDPAAYGSPSAVS